MSYIEKGIISTIRTVTCRCGAHHKQTFFDVEDGMDESSDNRIAFIECIHRDYGWRFSMEDGWKCGECRRLGRHWPKGVSENSL